MTWRQLRDQVNALPEKELDKQVPVHSFADGIIEFANNIHILGDPEHEDTDSHIDGDDVTAHRGNYILLIGTLD